MAHVPAGDSTAGAPIERTRPRLRAVPDRRGLSPRTVAQAQRIVRRMRDLDDALALDGAATELRQFAERLDRRRVRGVDGDDLRAVAARYEHLARQRREPRS